MQKVYMGQAQVVKTKPVSFEGDPEDKDVDLNSPEVKALLDKLVAEQVAGLKNKNDELLGKLKDSTEKAKQFEGYDPEQVKNLMNRLQTDEELKLITEGKVDEVVTRRTENLKKDYQSQIDALQAKLGEHEGVIKSKEERLAELVIDGQVREAYVGLDFEPAALDDVLRLARSVFIMNENGAAVPRDNNGQIIFSKDAKTPVSAKEWLENLAEKKTYLRRGSSGGGSKGSKGGSQNYDRTKASSKDMILQGLKAMGKE